MNGSLGLTDSSTSEMGGIMKRIFAVILTTVFLGAGVPASAGDVTSVTPNPVRQNKSITVRASDCVSGDSWEAFVSVSILNADGDLVYSSYQEADDDGTTVKSIKIKKRKYPKGNYVVYVDCVHEFDAGGSDYWYQTDHDLKVKRARRH